MPQDLQQVREIVPGNLLNIWYLNSLVPGLHLKVTHI